MKEDTARTEEGHKLMQNAYPFNRWEECTWQPEEVARNLSSIINESCGMSLSTSVTEISNEPGGSTRTTTTRTTKTQLMSPITNNQANDLTSNLLSRGWSSQVVPKLRSLYGANTISSSKEDEENDNSFACLKKLSKTFPCSVIIPIISTFIGQLKEPLILMLLGSACLSILLGNASDAISIFLALSIVSMVAAIQEYRSEQALEKLNDLVAPTCTVMRDGRVHTEFFTKDLVVGDLVLLSTGDRVPADCRLVDSIELFIDESSLTGENHHVRKSCHAIPQQNHENSVENPSLSDQNNIVFLGTLVVNGRGRALVVAVGEHTEFGKIQKELSEVEERKSPLQVKIDELGKMLALCSSAVIALIALVGWVLGRPFLETVTVGVSLAVAAIPEGLPICVAVTLALGVLRMAKMNAIVKKLSAVETLGCTSVIASDKTGTLTQNEQTVRSIYSLAFRKTCLHMTGVGYDSKEGKILKSEMTDIYAIPNYESSSSLKNKESILNKDSQENVVLSAIFNVASLCNNASIGSEKNISGQPTELALLVGALKANVSDPRPMYHRLQEIPFTSDRKRMEVKARPVGGAHTCIAFNMATTSTRDSQDISTRNSSSSSYFYPSTSHRASDSSSMSSSSLSSPPDGSLYFVKGMPEAVIAECNSFTSADGSPSPLPDKLKKMALSQSRKMAACGLRVLATAYGQDLSNLTFAGIVGMEDPPREGVVEAVQELREGGVNVIMVTGDSKETALAIAHRCSILGGDMDSSMHGSSIFDEEEDGIKNAKRKARNWHRNTVNDLESGSMFALSGKDLDNIPAKNLATSILGVKVFYRVAPRHKLILVKALQSQGEIVSMTGDGVNDATALKQADIGIAMGKCGTDVAKEAADIVLADDNFTTITKAIAEGKGIFFNIRNFLSFQLSTSFAALLMQSAATVLGLPSPLNAMQILWINIIMDGPPAQSLGVEPVEESVLRAKPRKSQDPIVSRSLLIRAVTSAILIVYLTLKVFSNELLDGHITRRDTTMTFMTFVNCDLFNAYTCRSANVCFYELSFFGNSAFLWAILGSVFGQLLVIYFPPLQEVFQTEALSIGDLLYIVTLSSSVLMLDTLRKKYYSNFSSTDTYMKAISKKDEDAYLSSEDESINNKQN